MDPAPASAAPAVPAILAPLPPIAPSKIRLMCSYGGRIVPRAHDKSLFYAGGDTRIVAVDRRTTASSFGTLYSHLSRVVFQNRPFFLKYQLPKEDLDSLISVISDEDVVNMLEEHDRISPTARIRLFLFPVEPQSMDAALLQPKSDAWFSDASQILRKSDFSDTGLTMRKASESDLATETGTLSSGGGESKLGTEPVLLETSSSFESSSSSLSMDNSSSLGKTQCDEKGISLSGRKSRVPSSASLESENSVGSSAAQKAGALEPVDQIPPGESSENSASDASVNVPTEKTVHAVGVPLPQIPDGKMHPDSQAAQEGLHYVHYTGLAPISPYYPTYQPPTHPHLTPYQFNQHYPVYLVPVRQSQHHNISMMSNFLDANTTSFSSIRPPLHLQTGPIFNPEVLGTRVTEAAKEIHNNIHNQRTSIPLDQSLPVMQPLEPLISPEPFMSAAAAFVSPGAGFDDDIAYNQIYKAQPSAPVLPSHHDMMANGTTVLRDA